MRYQVLVDNVIVAVFAKEEDAKAYAKEIFCKSDNIKVDVKGS